MNMLIYYDLSGTSGDTDCILFAILFHIFFVNEAGIQKVVFLTLLTLNSWAHLHSHCSWGEIKKNQIFCNVRFV